MTTSVQLSYANQNYSGITSCNIDNLENTLSALSEECKSVVVEFAGDEYCFSQTINLKKIKVPVTIKGSDASDTILKGFSLTNAKNVSQSGFIFNLSPSQGTEYSLLQTQLPVEKIKMWVKYANTDNNDDLDGNLFRFIIEIANYDIITSTDSNEHKNSSFILMQTKWMAIRGYINKIQETQPGSNRYYIELDGLNTHIPIANIFEGNIKEQAKYYDNDIDVLENGTVSKYLEPTKAKIYICNYKKKTTSQQGIPYLTYDRSSGRIQLYGSNNTLVQESYIQGVETFFHVDECNHVSFEKLKFENNVIEDPIRSSTEQAEEALKSALRIDNSSHVTINNCVFTNLHGYAIGVDTKYKDGNNPKGSHHVVIEKNIIYETNGGGIHISGNAHNCIVEDNLVSKYGRYQRACVGILVRDSYTNIIHRNTVADAPYTGICVGWSWDYDFPNGYCNMITNNHVFNCPTLYPTRKTQNDIPYGLSDGGGIYILGRNFGAVLENNVVHNITTFSNNGVGIYIDECSSDVAVRKNVCWGCDKGLSHNKGRACDIFYNFFACNDIHIHEATRETHLKSFVHHNIFYLAPFLDNNRDTSNVSVIKKENDAEVITYSNFVIYPSDDKTLEANYAKLGCTVLKGELKVNSSGNSNSVNFYLNPKLIFEFTGDYSVGTKEGMYYGLRLPEVCLNISSSHKRVASKSEYGSTMLPLDS